MGSVRDALTKWFHQEPVVIINSVLGVAAVIGAALADVDPKAGWGAVGLAIATYLARKYVFSPATAAKTQTSLRKAQVSYDEATWHIVELSQQNDALARRYEAATDELTRLQRQATSPSDAAADDTTGHTKDSYDQRLKSYVYPPEADG